MRVLFGFALGVVLTIAVPVQAGYYNFSNVAEALYKIAGSAKSSSDAQWKLVYWSQRQALAQERQARAAEAQNAVLTQLVARTNEQARAVHELSQTVARHR